MRFKAVLTDRLGLAYPIFRAPMAGGATTTELVAAVCKTGALGFLGPPDYTFLRKDRYQ